MQFCLVGDKLHSFYRLHLHVDIAARQAGQAHVESHMCNMLCHVLCLAGVSAALLTGERLTAAPLLWSYLKHVLILVFRVLGCAFLQDDSTLPLGDVSETLQHSGQIWIMYHSIPRHCPTLMITLQS